MSDEMQGPELDYAFLAEYARVEDDGLTAVGASYTQVAVATLPVTYTIYVAGRFRTPQNADPFSVAVTFDPGDDQSRVQLQTTMDPQREGRPYAGKTGVTFAVGFPVHLPNPGLYEVRIELNEVMVRRLAFSVNKIGAADPS
ncbi:hypothetical protein MHK71_08080 [Kocuria indica]|uniref:DUF6941 family protein n=1 Tax=Kocuria TaxID=57493 RepID=UPI001EF3E6E7|nr:MULTISPECIES: hypothetical protein [Kocuria]MCG7432459.1 hypothetical protein [Kocuria indica]